MGGIIRNIQEITKNMNRREKLDYILTYYWYHILGIFAVVGLIVFGIVHFAFPEEKPLFTCALVNQRIDSERDGKIAEGFADYSEMEEDRIRIDSDYIIAEESNASRESGLDKLLFQWSVGELDAVVMTEEFLSYCIEIGGEFHTADQFDTKGLELVKVDGVQVVELEKTKIEPLLDGTEDQDLVLVFPETGEHTDTCQRFLEYIRGK